MDFNHNGKDPSQFIEKAKKQAKRILQLSKTTPDNSFKVKSLSDAQQLLAKINGFPDWHAMNTYVFRSPSVLDKDVLKHYGNRNENKVTRCSTYPLNIDNVPYGENQEELKSSILLVLNLNVSNTLKLFNKLKDELEFTLNLKYQNISFTFIQNSFLSNENAYSLVNVAKEFNISEDDVAGFMFCEKNTSNQEVKRTERAFLLNVSTNKNTLRSYNGNLNPEDTHINFCKKIMEVFESFFSGFKGNSASFLNEDPYFMPDVSQSFNWIYQIENSDFSYTNEATRDYEIVKKFIFLVDCLIAEKMDIKINFDFTGCLNFFVADENSFSTFKKAFLSTKRCPEKMLLIEANWKFSPEQYKEDLYKTGLAFKQYSDGKIFRFNLTSENKKLPVAIFSENDQKPSEDLLKWIVMDNTFNVNNANKDGKTLVVAENYDFSFFKKRVSPYLKFKVIDFDCSAKTKLPNLFITPIGFNYINEKMAVAIFSSLRHFINDFENLGYKERVFLAELLKTLNDELEKKNYMDFHTHISDLKLSENQISKIYKLFGSDNLKKGKSIIDVIRGLWIKNEHALARTLQNEITLDVNKASETINSLDLSSLTKVKDDLKEGSNIDWEMSSERLVELQRNLSSALNLYAQKVEKDFNKFIGSPFDLASDYDFVVMNLKTSDGNDNFNFIKNYIVYLGSVFFLKTFINLPSPKKLRTKLNDNEFISKFCPSFKKNFAIIRADNLEGDFLYEVIKSIEYENASLIYTTKRLHMNFINYTDNVFYPTTLKSVVSGNNVKDFWSLETEVGDGSVLTNLLEFNRNLDD